jgi:hypothetical protein
MAIPKGQIPANVVRSNTVEGYLKFLADEVRRANDHWDHFGKAASAAYSLAYDDNGRILNAVRQTQAARKASEEAMMSFCLSLLTVGVAGGVAGGLISSSVKGAAKVATQTAARDLVKFVTKGVEGKVIDAVKALSPDNVPGADVFAPADTTPTTYMAKMLEGISYNKGLLEDVLHEVNYNEDANQVSVRDGSNTTVALNRSKDGQITLGSAKLLTEVITGTSFIQQMPSMSVNSDDLAPKARLALWIGWALNRDPDYWSDGLQVDGWSKGYIHKGAAGDSPAGATLEQLDWAPVRDALMVLKVPAEKITAQLWTETDWGAKSVRLGLYMWGFMEWAASTAALDLLLDNSVRTKDPMAVQMVYARKARRTLTPKNAPHPHWIQLPDPIVTPIN